MDGVKTSYRGGKIIQNAPLFPATGNHEVMGRFSMESQLKQQYNDAVPRAIAAAYYRETNPDSRDRQIPQAGLKTILLTPELTKKFLAYLEAITTISVATHIMP